MKQFLADCVARSIQHTASILCPLDHVAAVVLEVKAAIIQIFSQHSFLAHCYVTSELSRRQLYSDSRQSQHGVRKRQVTLYGYDHIYEHE